MGPTGDTTRWNIQRYREDLGLSHTELSRRLDELGRPIAPLGLRRIEAGERRVDADDLVALAIALGVNPNALLLQPVSVANGWVDVTGAPQSDAQHAWEWSNGKRALVYAPFSVPPRLYDGKGNPIPAGTVAFGEALHKAQVQQQQLEDEGFRARVDPGAYEGDWPPHSGGFPAAEYSR